LIVTLVTHSSRVSSSGVSRRIHHKCENPVNPTRLYVSGWAESCLSVLSNMLGWYVYMVWWIYILIVWMKTFML